MACCLASCSEGPGIDDVAVVVDIASTTGWRYASGGDGVVADEAGVAISGLDVHERRAYSREYDTEGELYAVADDEGERAKMAVRGKDAGPRFRGTRPFRADVIGSCLHHWWPYPLPPGYSVSVNTFHPYSCQFHIYLPVRCFPTWLEVLLLRGTLDLTRESISAKSRTSQVLVVLLGARVHGYGPDETSLSDLPRGICPYVRFVVAFGIKRNSHQLLLSICTSMVS